MVSSASTGIASVRTYTAYQPGDGRYDLFAQRLDAAGKAVGAAILVSTAAFPDTNATWGLATLLRDGGFLVVYDSEDPTSPVSGYTTVVRHYDAQGETSGRIATLGPFTAFDEVDRQRLLLANGGFAILSTNHQPFGAIHASRTDVTLLIGTPDGRIADVAVSHFETDNGAALPALVQTHATMRIGPDDTVLVSFDRYYTLANPDYPADEQHFELTYAECGQLVSHYFRDFDGTAETTTYDASGRVATDYVRHSDGSKTIADYGRNGTVKMMDIDSAGLVTFTTRIAGDGAKPVEEPDLPVMMARRERAGETAEFTRPSGRRRRPRPAVPDCERIDFRPLLQ